LPLADPALVPSTIAHSLGLKEQPGRPLLETLAEYLREKEFLLLLDNFEHLLAAASLVAELLRAAPRLTVSRRAVPPSTSPASASIRCRLSLPDPRGLDLRSLGESEALALFVERAQAVRPDFALTEANARALAGICLRLDGLPLALELAAARVRVLPPESMLRRLDRRLKLLTGGPLDLPARQQTLRAAIDWSYSLLDEREQRLFASVGVFAGGFTLDAAEAVCGPERGRSDDVFEGLCSLVEKSLLREEEGAEGEPRFSMLETIREYACERLAERGDEEMLRQRHGDHYLTLAEAAYSERTGDWLVRLVEEHDNLRAALDWLRERSPEQELQLAGALGWFWEERSHFVEGRQRLARLVSGKWEPERYLARALVWASVLALYQDDSVELLQRALEIWRKEGDASETAFTLTELGWAYWRGRGENRLARR
jgi:predicted ATPase